MDKIHIEVFPSLAETLGIDRACDEVIADQKIPGDYSVLDFLDGLCKRYHRFAQIVVDLDRQKLTGQVVIFLNGRNVDLVNGLETRLTDGDTLTFIPFVEGG